MLWTYERISKNDIQMMNQKLVEITCLNRIINRTNTFNLKNECIISNYNNIRYVLSMI